MGELNPVIGYLHSHETFGAVDGPGIRYVLFLQGCPLRCAYCHNPDTWSRGGEKRATPFEAMNDIRRYQNFIASGGVTLSGGEPLLQPEFCRELTLLCHQENIHVAIDTSGAIPLTLCREAVDAADLILLDIKALDSELCKQITGRDNQNALELLRYCEASGKPVWVRHVLVPGLTLEETRLHQLADYLSGFSCVRRVELLPYHKMGEYKWEALGTLSPLKDMREPTQEETALARQIFSHQDLKVQ